MLVTGVYCVLGGMYSVVINDLIQYSLIFLAAICIGAITIAWTTPEQIMAVVPAGWDNLFCGWQLDMHWSGTLEQLNHKIYDAPPAGDGYSLFGVLTLMLLFKGILVSMAGPTPNYAIQHVLSTRSPREAALENMMMALVSLGPRFLLIAGIAVLGLVFFSPELAAMVVCLVTRPEGDEVPKRFYRQVRPWGLWGPIYEKLRQENPNFQKNRDFPRDMFNVAVGMIWQTSMVTLPIYLVIQQYRPMWISLAVLVVTSLVLKFTWYDRLGPGQMYMPEDR